MQSRYNPGRMDTDNEIQLQLLGELDQILRRGRIRYWLRGGWARDFLTGATTRRHDDIDLVTWKRHAKRVRELLATQRFLEQPSPRPQTQMNFSKHGHQISVLFIERGAHGMLHTAGFRDSRWPATVIAGKPRRLGGLACHVISAEGLLQEIEKMQEWTGHRRRKDVASLRVLRQLVAKTGGRQPLQ